MTEETILTVSELTEAIKKNLETSFPAITLQGEISNCKQHSSGHIYFSLKDQKAQISAVMFRGYAKGLKKIPTDGDQVVVKGHLNVYPPSGRYQIVCFEMQLAGLGELLLKLEELKKKLHQMGWFSNEHKKELPKFPQKIGVITSPTGAAIQDILNVLGRRFRGIHVIINPVRVQGEGSANEIKQAIEEMNRLNLVDVMIVGRGGGSIEDLWSFNEECVAKAIFESKIPIICAVGHETDHCIAEYVADRRAPTPSAAAEIVTGELSTHLEFLQETEKRLQQTVLHLIKRAKEQLQGAKRHPMMAQPLSLLGPWMQRLDDLRNAVEALNPQNRIKVMKERLLSLHSAIVQSAKHNMQLKEERLQAVASQLLSIDPKNLLNKGYTLAFSKKDGSVITSLDKLSVHEQFRLLFRDGELSATVEEINKK